MASLRGSRAARASEAQHHHKSVDVVPRRRPQARSDETMADAASQKLANDLARAEARKTLWETELAGLAARREDDAAAAAAAVKSVSSRARPRTRGDRPRRRRREPLRAARARRRRLRRHVTRPCPSLLPVCGVTQRVVARVDATRSAARRRGEERSP